MSDPFKEFINDAVLYSKNDYYRLMFDTKKLFFRALEDEKINFKNELTNIWSKVDHSYMEETINQLDELVDKFNMEGHEILNPTVKFEPVYELTKMSKFQEIENKYEKLINKLFDSAKKTLDNGNVTKTSYLSKLVERYSNVQSLIPYYNKDGTIRSYHNIADYNSMLYNTNLTRSAWNRTLYDTDMLGNDLLYLPAHTFACPLCISSQGRVYSKSGKNKDYPAMEIALKQGVGHPNCKHVWVAYWDKEMIQTDKFDDEKWAERYKVQQKKQSLSLERKKLKVDRDIYSEINDTKKVDLINKKIKSLNFRIKELG